MTSSQSPRSATIASTASAASRFNVLLGATTAIRMLRLRGERSDRSSRALEMGVMGPQPHLRLADRAQHRAAGHLHLLGAEQGEIRRDVHVLVGDEDLTLPVVVRLLLETGQEMAPDEVLGSLHRVTFRFLGCPGHGSAQRMGALR